MSVRSDQGIQTHLAVSEIVLWSGANSFDTWYFEVAFYLIQFFFIPIFNKFNVSHVWSQHCLMEDDDFFYNISYHYAL